MINIIVFAFLHCRHSHDLQRLAALHRQRTVKDQQMAREAQLREVVRWR